MGSRIRYFIEPEGLMFIVCSINPPDSWGGGEGIDQLDGVTTLSCWESSSNHHAVAAWKIECSERQRRRDKCRAHELVR